MTNGTPPYVLLVSHTEDLHTIAVGEALKELGIASFRLDTNHYPENISITTCLTDSVDSFIDGTAVGLGRCEVRKVTAALYRRPEPPRFTAQIERPFREFAETESAAALDAVWNSLAGRWLNDPFVMRQARDKCLQLMAARHCGLVTPPTVVTNDPLAVPTAASAEIIYKPLRAAAIEDPTSDTAQAVFTTLLDLSLREELVRLQYAPGIFQEYIDKKYELRVTIVGDYCFACRIESQAVKDARTDWRSVDPEALVHSIESLPVDIQRGLRALMTNLNLRFACIDMIVTPTGQYVFLEANPNGQWLWIEYLTKAPIAAAIAVTLAKLEEREQDWDLHNYKFACPDMSALGSFS